MTAGQAQSTNNVMRQPMQGSNLKAQGDNVITANNEWLNANMPETDNFSVYTYPSKYTSLASAKPISGFTNENGETVAFGNDYTNPATIELVKSAATSNVKYMIACRGSYGENLTLVMRYTRMGFRAFQMPDPKRKGKFKVIAYDDNGGTVDEDENDLTNK